MSTLEQPAILGGRPAITLDATAANRWPLLTEEDEAAVLQVMRDGRISVHPVVQQLELEYADRFAARHALAHCNGTAALLAAFFALGLKPGDEVIVPTATWWASVIPMLWLGAIPVFAESEAERGGLDPEDVRQRITSRTRAIVIVHLWGMPSRMTELLAVAREHGLAVIEDASHAQGASWRGRSCGTLGDIGIFSLQGDKLAPAGEGGILLTNQTELFERAVLLGDVTRIMRLDSPLRRFAATSFGVKTRMAPLSAAIARGQLRRLEENNARRNGNIQRLSHRLEALGIHTFLPPPHIHRVYFEFLIRIDPQRIGLPIELLVEALQAEKCEINWPRYPLLHQQPLFTEGTWRSIARIPADPDREYRADDLPHTVEQNRRMLRLPSFPGAADDLLDQYATAFEKVVHNAAAIAERVRV